MVFFFFKEFLFLILIFIIYFFIFGCVGSLFLCEGFSLVAARGGHSSSRCAGLSLSRPLLLQSTSSRRAGSVAVAHGPSCSAACGILPDQGPNPCPLHWQADSQPLCHQGIPLLHLCSCSIHRSLPLANALRHNLLLSKAFQKHVSALPHTHQGAFHPESC